MGDNHVQMYNEYQIMGRLNSNLTNISPAVHRMKIWASDLFQARSKFWFFMRKICGIHKNKGYIISCYQIFERKPTISKNYGLWISYASRTGNHNAYKEYRDLTLTGAVQQLYSEMASRHRTKSESIQLIKTAVISARKCKRSITMYYNANTIDIPLIRKLFRPSRKLHKRFFKKNRPSVFSTFNMK